VIHKLTVFLLTLVAIVSGATIASQAQPQSLLTRHVREVTLNGQAPLVGHLSAAQPMRIVLVLPQRNQSELNDFLKELFDPSSSSYRKFLTVEEFTARFGPTQEDYYSVIRFAKANGLKVVGTSRNRMNLDVTGSVASIEKALHVTLGLYQHPTENRSFYAPDREPTPDLAVQLWHIAGLDNYSIPKPALVRRGEDLPGARSNATTGSGPGASFLGSDMRAAYYGGALTGSGQSLGLLEYVGTDLADLNTYYTNVHQTNTVPITLLSTDGTSTSCFASQGCDDTEQTLDMTQALGMAPGMASLVMYVGSSDSAIFNAMATAKPLNAQLSSSWTWFPADPSTDDPYFTEFAAQGQNLFQATGDSGKWTSSSEIWPADSEYITGVGGTDLDTSSAGGPWASETAWVDGGGGISPNKRPIPSWQVATAAGCSNCSQTLRNGPDVSANANFTFYVCADQTTCSANLYGGTSFAAPMWAGYMALVNQQYLANGSSTTLGFVNPLLYAIGLSSGYDADFHDITSGSNGYNATVGYDLATGWGSPNGANLINALAGAQGPGFSLSANPGGVTVQQGNSGTSTVTSTAVGGFNSAVTLSAIGQPTGVTVTFNPTSITGTGTSTMTMAVASTTSPGTYLITVKGTSGSTTETTAVSLTVTGPASFTLTARPTKLTLAPGGHGNSRITATPANGFNSKITLSASGQPSGVTVTFKPGSITGGSGSSSMVVQTATTTKAGTYTITVTGSGGGVTQTITFTLVIT
jgi:subtilase family serine protease